MNRKNFFAAAVFAALLILILDSPIALAGAGEGLQLCLKTVIPSLFPFMFLTNLAVNYFRGRPSLLSGQIEKLCRMPEGTGMLYLLGLLGGYPMGACAVSLAYEKGSLPKKEAERLLGFCSNAGPAFLFGMVGVMFRDKWICWVLWGIHILSSVLTALCLPGKAVGSVTLQDTSSPSFRDALEKSIRAIACVCGCVILFRVVTAFFERWFLFLLPVPGQIAVTGLLELTVGCCRLGEISCTGLRMILCSGILGFGGLCVLLQTGSVTGKLGLGAYLPGKLLQMFFSMILTWIVQYFLLPGDDRWQNPWILLLILPLMGLLFLLNRKNRSSISHLVGV